jgi:acyl-CoA thioesterase-1
MKLVTPQLNDSWNKQLKYLFHLVVRIILWSFALWVVLWIYDAVGNNRYASRIYVDRQSQYDVVAFGDSLVEGLGSEDLTGFVGLLEQDLGIAIYNAGHRRDTTADLLNRIDADVLAYQPQVVILVIGGNDAVRFVSEDEVLANLEQLFVRFADAGVSIVFGEVTDDVLYKNRNQKMRALAERHGVYYVPGLMKNVFWTLSNKFDPLHPDDKGYQLMAERIAPVLRNFLMIRGIIDKSPVQ